MSIQLSSRVVRTQGLVSGPAGDDLVILNMQGNNYVALDKVGRRIWELLAEPCGVEAICTQLAGEFSAPPGKIAADVLAFLGELHKEGLLRELDSPAG